MTELLPCPFCGDGASLVHDYQTGWHDVAYVICTKCGIKTQSYNFDYVKKSVQIAVKQWNRRVQDDC